MAAQDRHPAPADRSGEVFVIRRTASQRALAALGWTVFAFPLLGLLPFLAPVARGIVVTTVAVSGVLLAAFDLLVRRDLAIEIHPEGLRAEGRLLPWWAIDEVRERRVLGVRTIELDLAGVGLRLPIPRTGPLVPNASFDQELALLRAALDAARRDDPLRLGIAPGGDDELVIDLRDGPVAAPDRAAQP